MSFFSRNKKKIFVFVVVVSLLAIMAISTSKKGKITKVERFLGNVLSPANGLVAGLGNALGEKTQAVRDFFSMRQENEALKVQVAELEDLVRKQEMVIATSEALKREFDLIQKSQYEFIEAKVIGKDPGNWFDIFTIGKGSKDGIVENQTIVSAVRGKSGIIQEGIVGKVIAVGDNWAKVESIVDEQSSISFKISRSLDGGILSGTRTDEIEGYMFDEKSDVRVGDKVLTSGLGGVYAEGIYIGVVSDVQMSEDNLMKLIKLEPAVDFQRINRVFAIIEKKVSE